MISEFVRAKQKLVEKFLLPTLKGAASSATTIHQIESVGRIEITTEKNIVGVGISKKASKGTLIDCITVYVIRKTDRQIIPEEFRVPVEIDGIPVDVVESGIICSLQTYCGQHRPAWPGISVGPSARKVRGTLGALVQDRNGLFYILSNNHVLVSPGSRLGDLILQPSLLDGGSVPADEIAKLSKFIPINFGKSGSNYVDCAIAETSRSQVNPHPQNPFFRIGAHSSTAIYDLRVKKVGATTGLTEGKIIDCDATMCISYGVQEALFENLIVIESLQKTPFSDAGDSGALIVSSDEGCNPIGLLFAGSKTYSVANYINEVLKSLDITIVV